MLTVSKLARRCGLSRSALLYYESIGLLRAAGRSAGNYRAYGERDQARLEQICLYRDAGLRLADIRAVLDGPTTGAAQVLRRRLGELHREIEARRRHQQLILRLLQNKNSLRKRKTMTKDKWKAIMQASGFSEKDMQRWHVEFERAAPDDHQQFLEYLHIPATEVRSIREWSRKQGA